MLSPVVISELEGDCTGWGQAAWGPCKGKWVIYASEGNARVTGQEVEMHQKITITTARKTIMSNDCAIIRH